jgi:hypothetical protein
MHTYNTSSLYTSVLCLQLSTLQVEKSRQDDGYCDYWCDYWCGFSYHTAIYTSIKNPQQTFTTPGRCKHMAGATWCVQQTVASRPYLRVAQCALCRAVHSTVSLSHKAYSHATYTTGVAAQTAIGWAHASGRSHTQCEAQQCSLPPRCCLLLQIQVTTAQTS